LTLEAWAGETRVNLIRLAALVGFYANHLVQFYLMGDDPTIDASYHQAVTALVVAWSVLAAALQIALTRNLRPRWLPHAVTAWDLALITLLLAITPGGGPRSGLVVLYYLVIAAAPLRLSRSLVGTATLGAMVGYLLMLGHYVYFVVGSERYYAPEGAVFRIPRTTEIIFLLGLGAAGLLAGQVVRQTRRLLATLVMVSPQEKT
jgi:hypothetical protein